MLVPFQASYFQMSSNKFVNKLGALSFVPINRINEAMHLVEIIKPNDPKCDEFFKYFKQRRIKRNMSG